eukprot:CAMPEP_0119061430 /NCGR_PEP_ID=MMETSP1178-20130426/5220_1 /TAXON_ID=33656 /ORGANISM="unid sp, Strain CCMP2000" /LENGTH=48 /DNA_ID= /DNA_START= /DNA_END= /DNA_ORIENTATION=
MTEPLSLNMVPTGSYALFEDPSPPPVPPHQATANTPPEVTQARLPDGE